MRSLIRRALGGFLAASAVLGVAATPAAAADDTTFRLAAGGFAGKFSYRHMMGNPERPVPPIRITGTLTGRYRHGCAVVQVARSGPADGIEWQTTDGLCGPGRSQVRIAANYLFRGVQPPVRLCAGRTLRLAERARTCDVHRPGPQAS